MKKPAPPLPPACSQCRLYGGIWQELPGGALARCGCPRGRALAAGKVKRVYAGVTGKASPERVKGHGSVGSGNVTHAKAFYIRSIAGQFESGAAATSSASRRQTCRNRRRMSKRFTFNRLS